MLTNIRVRNFKRFQDIEFELGQSVVLIGPNNSGKTTALQALALWGIGIKQWLAKRQGKSSAEQRPGVTINRKDLLALPIPDANLLWRDLRVRTAERGNGTQNIRIEIIIDGITAGKNWSCGLEFDYANEESFYCRPLRKSGGEKPERLPVPEQADSVNIAFLPPMSGLAAVEPKWEPGRINVLLGEGQTAQVLRNLCYRISEGATADWLELTGCIRQLFGVTILPPSFDSARGEITMRYQDDPHGPKLDISATGRGLQQTLLLLAHLYSHPQTVLLLDEPDAHLEVLRQRQIYQLLTQTADRMGSQIIAASHSEVVLNEAADRDMVIAFVGKPHRIDDRGSQVLKSLRDIGFDQYALAEQTGWVLYLEGSTDLAILQAFAEILRHPASSCLARPFVHYVGNHMAPARSHFHGLREAKDDLVGIAILDRDEREERELPDSGPLKEIRWKKRELENYFTREDVLLAYACHNLDPTNLCEAKEIHRRETAMKESIDEVTQALRTLRNIDPWSADIKATDNFLDPLFRRYYQKIGLPDLLRKTDYYVLARLLRPENIDPEIIARLDAIAMVAGKAVACDD